MSAINNHPQPSSPGSGSSSLSDLKRDEKKGLDFSSVEANEIDPDQNVLDNKELRDYYAPVDSYEGRHRFDPESTWTEEEENAVVRKVDLRVMSFACLIFFALQLDRGNLGSALADGFLKDNGMTTQDYNNGQSIFFCCFLFSELPSQLMNKWLGTTNWVPFQIMAWSAVTIGQGWISNRNGFFITRALLGLAEGGLIPDLILYLTFWYKNEELPLRLSAFWATLTFTGIVQGFIAYGVLRLRSLGLYGGWSYLFWIEGALTFTIGLAAAFYLPASPTTTAGRLRGKKGWFNEREEIILVNRVLRDDPTKGTMSQVQHISWKDFKACLTDFDNYPLYFFSFAAMMPATAPSAYLTLVLKGLGFSTLNIQLLAIPYQVFFMFNCFGLAFFAKKTNQRAFSAIIGQAWALVILIALVCTPSSVSPWVRYALLSLLLAYPYSHPIMVGWNSTNSGSVRLRTVSASFYNMMTQVGQIASTQIYRAADAPRYNKANSALAGVAAANIVLLLAIKGYFMWRNRQKRAVWNALTSEEKDHYAKHIAPTIGNKSLLFEFKH
ncbi:major facilitator superfamily domain-containing protein [Mrakia frigida]|uniref:major facilitator superfamily domain-containing protein n=1 Tax=Mrakia frigida TaxID=29902 RepID=UPI003FCC142A